MQVETEILSILSRSQVNGSAVLLPPNLDRAIYLRTDKVLQAAGGKWSRSNKAHLFDGDAEERLDQIIISGRVDVAKDDFDFFPTPPEVVDKMLRLAGDIRGKFVLEPQGGLGAIAYRCADAGAIVDCYELMEKNFIALSGDPRLRSVQHADFLAQEPRPIYDLVIMNPPFSKQADIKHVLHARRFLKAGGNLISVMAAGCTFRENKLSQEFREMVFASGGKFEALPEGSFKKSGTMVNTVIATMRAEVH